MQKIEKILENIPAQFSSSKALEPIITPQDNVILGLKYKSRVFSKMAPAELLVNIKQLVLKIHIITGWEIPPVELMGLLVDQFQKKILESYGQMNADEVEYAFRTFGNTVENWGKSMNLNLIDKILIPYLESRFEVSKVEERLKLKPNEKILSDQELLNERRKITEDCYQRFLRGNTTYFPFRLMADVLLIDGLIERGTKGEDVFNYFANCQKLGKKNIYTRD